MNTSTINQCKALLQQLKEVEKLEYKAFKKNESPARVFEIKMRIDLVQKN